MLLSGLIEGQAHHATQKDHWLSVPWYPLPGSSVECYMPEVLIRRELSNAWKLVLIVQRNT